MVEIFFSVATFGKKVSFFYDEWMVTMVIGGYLWYVEVNFQWFHNEYGRVGHLNLNDDQRNLTIVQEA